MIETFKKMSPSIPTLVHEYKNIFTKVDWEYRDFSTLQELLPHLVSKDSEFDVKNEFQDLLGMDHQLQVQKLSNEISEGDWRR